MSNIEFHCFTIFVRKYSSCGFAPIRIFPLTCSWLSLQKQSMNIFYDQLLRHTTVSTVVRGNSNVLRQWTSHNISNYWVLLSNCHSLQRHITILTSTALVLLVFQTNPILWNFPGHWWYVLRTKGQGIDMPIKFIQFHTFNVPIAASLPNLFRPLSALLFVPRLSLSSLLRYISLLRIICKWKMWQWCNIRSIRWVIEQPIIIIIRDKISLWFCMWMSQIRINTWLVVRDRGPHRRPGIVILFIQRNNIRDRAIILLNTIILTPTLILQFMPEITANLLIDPDVL